MKTNLTFIILLNKTLNNCDNWRPTYKTYKMKPPSRKTGQGSAQSLEDFIELLATRLVWYNSHQEHELNDNVIRRLRLEHPKMSQELEEEPYNYDLTSVRGALQIFFDMVTDKEINKIKNLGSFPVTSGPYFERL